MNNSKRKKRVQIGAWVATAVMVVAMLMPVGFSSAQDRDELLEQVALLQQQIETLRAQLDARNTAPAGYTFTRNLSQGSRGEDVRQLQILLNRDQDTRLAAAGPGSPGSETDYFGPITRNAVIRFQEKYRSEVLAPLGLTSGTGFVGERTRAKLNELGTVTAPTDPAEPTDPDPVDLSVSLSADPGSVTRGQSSTLRWESENAQFCESDEFDTDGEVDGQATVTPNETTVYIIECYDADDESVTDQATVTVTDRPLEGGEGYISLDDLSVRSIDIDLGDSDVVIESEIEARDSDVEIRRVEFMFDKRPWLYFDEVRLMMDGEEVGSLSDSVGNYSQVGDAWRARFSNLDQVIRRGDKLEMNLEVDVKSAMAGTRDQDTVTVWMESDGIRFIDGANIMSTSGEIIREVRITFDDRFGRGSLDVSLNDDSPDRSVFEVDERNRTEGVVVLRFDAEAEDSSIEVLEAEVEVNYDSDPSSRLEDVIRRIALYADGRRLDVQTASGITASSTTFRFRDLDHQIARGRTAEFRVEVDFRETDAANFHVPGQLEVYLKSITAEDADFELVSGLSNLRVGQGNINDVIVEGLTVELDRKVATTERFGDDGREGIYEFRMDVTAVNEDFYISDEARDVFGSDYQFITLSGSASSTIESVSVDSSAPLTADNTYRIRDGRTETFDITVRVRRLPGEGAGSHRITLEKMEYGIERNDPFGWELRLGSPDFRSSQLFLREDS